MSNGKSIVTIQGEKYKRTSEFIPMNGMQLRIYRRVSDNQPFVLRNRQLEPVVLMGEVKGQQKLPEPKEKTEKIEEVEKTEIIVEGTGVIAKEAGIIKQASEYASVLSDVIEKQKLYTNIKGRKYVRVEGWQVLGALLKCRAVITEVKETPEYFEATAEIINQRGEVMGRGVARCYFSEKNWQDRDKYAVLSMAQTRAIGKAYRNNFAWILGLAGYEPTPAEEVE